MPGFIPNEGQTVRGDLAWKNDGGDREANLELGLFTNVAPGKTITLAAITEPTGGAYARIDLTDALWTEDDNAGDRRFSYPAQIFSPSGSDYVGDVQGYFIATKSAGGVPRLLAVEIDSVNGPLTLRDGDTYEITPRNTEK